MAADNRMPGAKKGQERKDRLAAALRDNLRRRKEGRHDAKDAPPARPTLIRPRTITKPKSSAP